MRRFISRLSPLLLAAVVGALAALGLPGGVQAQTLSSPVEIIVNGQPTTTLVTGQRFKIRLLSATAIPANGSFSVYLASVANNGAGGTIVLHEAIPAGDSGPTDFPLPDGMRGGGAIPNMAFLTAGSPGDAYFTRCYQSGSRFSDGAMMCDIPPAITIVADTQPSFASQAAHTPAWLVSTAVDETLPAASGGNAPLSYALTPALPAGLSFNQATRQITGTATTAGASATYTLTATDFDGDTATLTFDGAVISRTLSVTGPSTIAEGAADVESAAYTVTLAGGNFTAATAVTWTVTHGETADADFAAASDRSGTVNFGATDTSMTFTLTVAADMLNEASESFSVQVSVADATADGGTAYGAAHSTSITDDSADAIEVAIARTSAANVNEAATAEFSVTLSGGVRTDDLIMPFDFDGTLNNAEYDITMPSGLPSAVTGSSLTFPVAGTPLATDSMTITVNLIGDTLNEAAETLILTGAPPDENDGLSTAGVVSYATNGDTAMVTVDDDDPITVTIARATTTPATVDEGATVEFVINPSVAHAGRLTVAYSVTSSTVGYTPTDPDNGSIDLPPSTTITPGTISLTLPDSAALGSNTPDGGITVTLGSASVDAPGGGAVTSSGSATVTVNFLDAHTIEFASPTTALVEGAAATTYTVRRSGPDIASDASIVVRWTYAAGGTNPAAAADFTGGAPAGSAFTFVGNETEKTFEIAVADDADSEPDETFTLGLTADPGVLTSNGGVALGADVTVTIGESDRPVTLAISGPLGGLTEGTAENFVVSFAESVTTSEAVEVDWAIEFPAASAMVNPAAAADFTIMQSGTASIAAGAMTGNIPITAAADMLNEAAERFSITLSNPRGGGAIAAPMLHASNNTDSAEIAESDPITVSVARASGAPAAVDEGGTAAFTFSLSVASAGVVTVPYTVTSDSTPPYTPTDSGGGSLTFAAGATSQDITLTLPNSPTHGSTTTGNTLTVTLGSASVAAPGGGTVASTGSETVMVNFRDNAHNIAFASPATALAEGGAATTYTVTRSGGTDIAEGMSIVVSWTYTAGATDAADFTGGAPAGGAFTFVRDETEKTFEIDVADDADSEPDETFTLGLTAEASVLTSNGGVDLGDAVTVTIAASDQPVTLSIAAPAGGVMENAAADFAVSFPETVTTDAPVMVDWAIEFPTASDTVNPASGADFSGMQSGTASIAAGEDTVNVAITTAEDVLSEAAETFIVRLSNPRGGGAAAAPMLHATPSVEAAIAENDPVSVRIAAADSVAASEGDTANFTLIAGRPGDIGSFTLGGDLCVEFSTAISPQQTPANTADNADIEVSDCDDTAVAVAADGSASGVFRFRAGSVTSLLFIPVRFDNLDEGTTNEMLTVTITGIVRRAGAGPATLSPMNSASRPLMNVNALRTLSVSAPVAAVNEDSATAAGTAAEAVFTLRLTGASPSEALNVPWSLSSTDGSLTLPGAASAGAGGRSVDARDLPPGTPLSGTVVFPASVALPAEMMVRVPIAQDALNEGAERLNFALGEVPPGAGGQPRPEVPGTQVLAGGTAEAVVAPSDAITIFIAPAAGEPAMLLSGQNANYVMSFGTTTVNGVAVPIVPTAAFTVPVRVTVGGTATPINVQVPADAATVPVPVPAATINAAAQSSTTTLTVAVDPAALPAATSSGGPLAVGTQADLNAQPDAPSKPAVAAPTPQQVAGWELTIARAEGTSETDAPEGDSYELTFTLDGDAAQLGANGLSMAWSVAARGANPAAANDFGPAGGYSCSPDASGACSVFPSGTVTFTTGVASRTLSIAIFDDGIEEGTAPEGFSLTLNALTGADAARTTLAAGGLQPGVLELQIPALRADLRIANDEADEGENADFALTLSNFRGGNMTTQPVTVTYTLGMAGDTAESGADYTPPSSLTASIAAGAGSVAISIPLVADGLVEPPETFTVTITAVTRNGGGSIRLVDAAGNVQTSISATGTISGAGDASKRRQQRVSALATVLDRQAALLATDAITARLSRTQSGSGGGAELSIANRNLLGARAAAAQSTDSADPELGLALYGAAGLGGAAAGRPGAGAAGAGFGGLGAGLAGGANMGAQTALPDLAQLLNGSRFAFQVSWRDLPKQAAELAGELADGVQIWGSGGFTNLRGVPGGGLSYNGDSAGVFLGADVPVRDNLLAGLALGWTDGKLNFTDRAGDFTTSGKFSNDGLSVHPYLGWQISDHAKAWLVLGFGAGSVEIDESDSSGNSRSLNSGGSDMRMFSAGIDGEQPFSEATKLRLRFAVTRVQSRVDLGVFDDGAFLPKSRGRSLRVGGEAEVGHRILLANGLLLRPFGTLGMRLDNTGSSTPGSERGIENEALDWGGGLQAAWPALGLDGRFAFSRQLTDGAHEEQRISATVNFDPGADSQGFTLAMQTAMQSSTPGAGGGALGTGAFGAGASSAFGASGGAFGNALGAGAVRSAGAGEMQQSVSGEIAYGMAFRLRQSGHSGWLTPYARFALRSADTRWAAGLRLAEPRSGLQVGLEAALDRNAASTSATTTGSSYNLLLTGQLRF